MLNHKCIVLLKIKIYQSKLFIILKLDLPIKTQNQMHMRVQNTIKY